MRSPAASCLFIFIFVFVFLLRQDVCAMAESSKDVTTSMRSPFTPRASLIRYWSKEIPNNRQKSPVLLSKASPLSVVQTAFFSKLTASNTLHSHLPEFCAAAKLFCFPDMGASLTKHSANSIFEAYSVRNFTNYGTSSAGGFNSFKNYSIGYSPLNSFRRYSRDSAGHEDSFVSYGANANINDQSFNSYGVGATGGAGKFTSYSTESNVPDVRFSSYGDGGNGRSHAFSTYGENGNSGSETFTSYGKNENGPTNTFTSYANNTNVNSPNFNNYAQSGNGANDTFMSYGFNGNVPENKFKNYGAGGNVGEDTFVTYREQSNVGDDSFQSYEKKSNSGKAYFTNYGKSFNQGTTKFTGYGQETANPTIGFKIYGINTTFKEYSKTGVSFAEYTNITETPSLGDIKATIKKSGRTANKWMVEPGKFFRESMLKKGTVMPMPDIADKMPQRLFLPRIISSKLPFSSSKIEDIKKIFHAADDSAMEKMVMEALQECERVPSPGETKQCVGSAEDMIDFATSVLGRNIAVRTTDNIKGSKGMIVIGDVKGINGGALTKSVSCHQSLYPYLLYYCHAVPRVRVYEANILDRTSKSKINHGFAICHVDTSSWSPTHGAFLSLGGGPGRIEVCHWIFENDMTWTVADG